MILNVCYFRIILKLLLYISFMLSVSVQGSIVLLNSSYDTARELFMVINSSFIRYWKTDHPNDDVIIQQSHSGSTKQAMTVLQGLRADVVTYNQVTDVHILYDRGKLIPCNWQFRLPNNSSPFYSTIAFVVRKGNPKKIYDWDNLTSEDIKIVFPNPKTSGSGRYVYLAAWNVISSRVNNLKYQDIRSWMSKFLHNVLVFDIGSRSATATFVDQLRGDILITFEAEANIICEQHGRENYEIIIPEKNILVEFPVTWIDANVGKHGTEAIAKSYLQYLYTEEAQKIFADFYYRVHVPSIMKAYSNRFPDIELFRVEDQFSDWNTVMCVHFNRGGELDKLLAMRHNR
ncbi:thiosulfate-binding protein [Blochmannia endosymbiont of Polyrhachis (Hedomyrma) turneri]|nr:thiosulfate-binding protein [Blochmannia endosymbiont of Polyrhachis (Hedomyrma) turneri]